MNKSPKTALSPTFQPPHLPSPIGIPRSSHLSPETNIKIQNQFIYSNLKEYRCKPQNSPVWLVQGAAIYINIAAPCTTEIHIENQHLTLLVKPRVQPRFLHHLLILCFSCNPVIPKNKKSPKHFPFSVKIPIFASVPRAERSNAAKPAQLPNRYRLPNFLLFKSYLPTDYKKTIVFFEKSVFVEYETFLLNENNKDIKYKYVDNINIYKFIKEIKNLPNNNNIKDFESADNIISYLREQFAGLMKKFFIQEQRENETNLIRDINNTATTLKELVDYIQLTNKDKEDELKEIIKTSHPIIGELKKYLNIKYKFYIEDFNDLKNLLSARSFREADNNKKEYIFTRYYQEDGESDKLFIDKSIFDNNMKLKLYRPAEWKEDFISFKREKIEDNLPF